MDGRIRHRLLHEVTHHMWLNNDRYGDPTYHDPPVVRRAYKWPKLSVVRSLSGDLRESRVRLYLDGLFEVTGQDIFEIDGVRFPVITYEQFDGLRAGTGTTVVYL